MELEPTVLRGMDSIEVKTMCIQRFAMMSKRWVIAYMDGLSEGQRAFAEKQYKSHRRETRGDFVS